MTLAWSTQSRAAGQGGDKRCVDALRVLVVEDHAEDAEALRAMLQRWKCNVEVCRSGGDALDGIAEFLPHIAVISLDLPDMRGCDVAHRVYARGGSHCTLLISLSTRDQESERRRANALGFDFHLIKPVDSDEFHRAMTQMAHDYGLPLGAATLAE
ncbi:MAG TPA: response regulator [Pirellulales bacterium]|jgi:CheY-like chemotaxis protein|nr:response regulator [Pirellulales bacterium]